MNKSIYALGRLKQGEMNKTELAYSKYLEMLKQANEVLWYKFEGIKFRLADNTFYTPDFIVMNVASEIEAHEVKGSISIFQDDAKVKVKVAASLYPIKFIVVTPKPKRDGGGWNVREY